MGKGSGTTPPTHHRPYGGDWGLDFYAVPWTAGRFWTTHSAGLSKYGKIAANFSACLSPGDSAGLAYKIDIYDSTGKRGRYIQAHVNPFDSFGSPYMLPIGTTLGNGALLGHTYQFAYSGCYQVMTTAGVHWHLEMSNLGGVPTPSHRACWWPTYSLGGSVSYTSALGAIGSNATSYDQPCW